MDIIIPFIKPAIDVVTNALGIARKRLSKRKYEELLSTIIAELIKEHPNISFAEAKLAAAEATGAEPTMELFRAKSMLDSVRTYKGAKPGKKAAATKASAGKSASKKSTSAAKPSAKRSGRAPAKSYGKQRA